MQRPAFLLVFHPAQILQGEGRIGQRLDGNGQQAERVVVRRHPVGVEHAAPAAPVDDGPLPAPAHPDADGSITPPQREARSPGVSSRWMLHRQWGQWLWCAVPAPVGAAVPPQTRQTKWFSVVVKGILLKDRLLQTHLREAWRELIACKPPGLRQAPNESGCS